MGMFLSMFLGIHYPSKMNVLCLCFSDIASLHSVGLVRELLWPLYLNYILHTKKHQAQGSALVNFTVYTMITNLMYSPYFFIPINKKGGFIHTPYFLSCRNLGIRKYLL